MDNFEYEFYDWQKKYGSWEEYTKAMSQHYNENMNNYNRNFKVETIIFRDEILSRLRNLNIARNQYADYESPVNPIGIGFVVDDLEKLAKLLPQDY
ncbi:MAG: hypothetical protein CVT49_16340 [candidate division Zixibacteria bacterium HGW-Zixibacteria-1]|nr:MAG: hypothetical protein CVT49_16340 [candidate division Zixibacteria bacterium HGW-Zixibacteria-1]